MHNSNFLAGLPLATEHRRKWMLEKLSNVFSPDVYVTEVVRRVNNENLILFMFRDSHVSFPTDLGTFTASSMHGFAEDSLRELFIEYAGSHINLVNRMLGLQIVGPVGIEVPLGALLGFPELYIEMLQKLAESEVFVTFFVLLHDSDDMSAASDAFNIVVKSLVQHGADFVLDNIQGSRDLDVAAEFFEVIEKFRVPRRIAQNVLRFEEILEKAAARPAKDHGNSVSE